MSINKHFPRLLVISNSCMSNMTSNGRTIKNFLLGWNKEKIAQFFIQNETPDFTVCKNFFRVTDTQALRAFIYGEKPRECIQLYDDIKKHDSFSTTNKSRRNSVTMFLRELVWNSNRWRKCGFEKWVEDFSPEVVLLQAGDSPFMFKIALNVCEKFNIPLIIYNSEVYYYKNYDYFNSKGVFHFFYPLFHAYYKKIFDRTINYASKSIYISEMVQKKYDNSFKLPSETVYTSTEVKRMPKKKENPSFVVSYLGNLGVGRHESLIVIGDVLQKISTDYKLDVYGKIPDDTVLKAFASCKGINYRGYVSYEQVLNVMQSSDLLVHVENFSEYYKKDLQYAFSTKIADSLASGVGFLLFAPEEMSCSRYLKNNNAAFVISDRSELFKTLKMLSDNPDDCQKFCENALALVEKNHNSSYNTEQFQRIILNSIND